MGVLGEGASWCFCSGGGKSEKVKGGIFNSKGPAMAAVMGGGTGFLIHRNLLLTTHGNLPSATAAEAAEIQIHHGRLPARLVPQRFFITSNILDLTIVGLDVLESESNSLTQQPHCIKTCCNPCLKLGSVVFVLGHTDQKELTVGEGKVVIATDNLIKVSTEGVSWCPGSAGFDVHGNLAFMVCDPMKCASSPTAKSTSTSSSSLSWKKDCPTQFGIPIPIICDWLHQHWEGNLDELSKPKLPLRRLISSAPRSDSCASFTLRSVFKPAEAEDNEASSSSSQIISKPTYQGGTTCSTDIANQHGSPTNLRSSHDQGILTPEIYESPKLTSGPAREDGHIQLLDINFPPKASRSIVLPLPIRQLLPDSNGCNFEKPNVEDRGQRHRDVPPVNMRPVAQRHRDVSPVHMRPDNSPEPEDAHILPPSVQGDCFSEVESSSSPMDVTQYRHATGDGFSSECETMYSAETMESRNYPTPKHDKFYQVGRSQSCVSYSRWGSSQRNTTPTKSTFQKQRSMAPPRKTNSHAATVSQRSHDYNSPTVSSIMKKRANSEQRPRARPTRIQDSPRWMF